MTKAGRQTGRDATLPTPPLGHAPRRTVILLIVLALIALVWPLSRWLLTHSVAPPPATDDIQERLRYFRTRVKNDPSDTSAYVELGRLAESAGYYMAGLEQLQIARALGASDAQTARLMGRCMMRLGRTDEGRAELERAVRAQPDNVDAALDIAVVYYEAGRSEDALRTLRFYRAHHPLTSGAPVAAQREPTEKLMNAFTQVGDVETGAELAKRVIALAPNEPNGYAVAGRNLLAQKRPAEAAELLARAVKLAPDNATVHYLYGMALARLPGKRPEALVQWQAAVAKEDHALAYGEIGGEYARQKDWRRAAIAYLHMGQIEKEDPRPYLLSAAAWQEEGDSERSLYCRAKATLLQGNGPAAVQQFKVLAQSADPDRRQRGIDGCVEAYRLLPRMRNEELGFLMQARFTSAAEKAMRIADVYGELKNFGKRKAYLEKALQLDPSLAGHVHHELGKIEETNGFREEAEAEYKLSIAARAQDASCHRSLCLLYLDTRDKDDRVRLAVREAEQVVRLSPGEASDQYQLGVAYAAAKDYLAAVKVLQHAIDLQPGYGPPYLDLGQIAQRLGNRERANELFQLYRKYQAYDLQKQTLTTRARTDNKNAGAQIALADFCLRAHDYTQAAFFYTRAVRLKPQDRLYRAKLGKAYTLLGRPDEQQEESPTEGTSGSLHP